MGHLAPLRRPELSAGAEAAAIASSIENVADTVPQGSRSHRRRTAHDLVLASHEAEDDAPPLDDAFIEFLADAAVRGLLEQKK